MDTAQTYLKENKNMSSKSNLLKWKNSHNTIWQLINLWQIWQMYSWVKYCHTKYCQIQMCNIIIITALLVFVVIRRPSFRKVSPTSRRVIYVAAAIWQCMLWNNWQSGWIQCEQVRLSEENTIISLHLYCYFDILKVATKVQHLNENINRCNFYIYFNIHLETIVTRVLHSLTVWRPILSYLHFFTLKLDNNLKQCC